MQKYEPNFFLVLNIKSDWYLFNMFQAKIFFNYTLIKKYRYIHTCIMGVIIKYYEP